VVAKLGRKFMWPSSHPVDPVALPLARVLLVENDPLIAMSVVDQLAELGYSVVGPAHTLEDGRQLAADAEIDVALVDWNLDRTTAADIADILAARRIPFAFVTGYAEIPQTRFRGIALLNKPFTMEILAHTIQRLRGATEPET
jgi:CheY-like chemotaxis protein